MPRRKIIEDTVREESLRDYCAGLSIAEISKKYGIKNSTVKTWKKRYKWEETKNGAIDEAVAIHSGISGGSMYEKYLIKITQTTEQALEDARIAVFMAGQALSEIHKIEMRKKERRTKDEDGNEVMVGGPAMRNRVDKISKIMRIVKDSTTVMATAMPCANEDLAQKIVEEMEQSGFSKNIIPMRMTNT